MVIQVRNTGAPLTVPGIGTGHGVGLRNVRQRLQLYYNGAATLTLTSDAEGATIAELRMPAPVRGERGTTAVTGPAA